MNAKLIKALQNNKDELRTWQETMHKHPELSMQEENTARYIAEVIRSFGAYTLTEGVGKYGMVASLKVGNSNKAIGIRADFDGLPIQEENHLPYKSSIEGCSHLCGHDGRSSLVMALQTIVSRNVSPWKQSVVTIGSFQSGNAGNVIPQKALLKLSIRNMDKEVRGMVLERIRHIARSQAEAFHCALEIREGIPGTVLVNTPKHTRWAADVTAKTFGEDRVERNADALMGSEDFAFMLEKCPGNYVMMGNGQGYMVHHPHYVFNQELLPLGATYWVSLVEDYLNNC